MKLLPLKALVVAALVIQPVLGTTIVTFNGTQVQGDPGFPPIDSLTLQFDVPSLPFAGFSPRAESFDFTDVPVSLQIDNTPASSTSNSIGWFAYSNGYRGVDMRFTNLNGSAAMIQIIVGTQTPLFAGPTSAPLLSDVSISLSTLGAVVFYYPSPGAPYFHGYTMNGDYRQVTVPDSAATGILVAITSVVLWVSRRKWVLPVGESAD